MTGSPHTIVRIENAGPDRRARRLIFDDESEPRTTSAAVVRALGVREGTVVDDDEVAAIEPDLARDRALNYLGYRERSTHELTKRLVDDGYPHHLATRVTSRFQELGLVDDERFAGMWARTRVSAGYGRRRIERELVTRGVDPDLAAQAVGDACGGDDVESARASLRGKLGSTRAERQRLVRKLVHRGFDLRTALEATSARDGAQDTE